MTPEGLATGKPFPARLTCVGEPGGKVRVPTITLAALIGYLQPYGHAMRGVLAADPTLRAGLTAANQVWEFMKDFEGQFADQEAILLGDLEEATNWITHEVGLLHMEAFLDGLSAGNNVTDYVRNAPSLFLSPLLLKHEEEEYLTCSGAPMGIPGVKILLHSLGKAIDKAANQQLVAYSIDELKKDTFRSAGDDIMKLGPLSVLERHKSAARDLYKVKPSADKWGTYLIGGQFCEQGVVMRAKFTVDVTHVDRFHVDHIRGKLLSPETKPFSGDIDTNPIFGKGAQLAKELSYLPPGKGVAEMITFLVTFREFGDCHQLAALPIEWGGFGFRVESRARHAWLGPELRRVIATIASSPGTKLAEKGLSRIRRLSQPLLYDRGEKINEEDDYFVDFLIENFSNTLEEVEGANRWKHPPNTRYYDRIKHVLAHGYVSTRVLSSKLIPYWERSERPAKGWATAPMSLRLKRLADYFGDRLEADPPEHVLQEILDRKFDVLPPQRFIPRKCQVINTDEGPEDLNVMAKGFGLSLHLLIPTKDLIFGTDADVIP